MEEKKPSADELEKYFAPASLPGHLGLGPGETITDCKFFVSAQLDRLKHTTHPLIADIYYQRLLRLKNLLDQQLTAKPV